MNLYRGTCGLYTEVHVASIQRYIRNYTVVHVASIYTEVHVVSIWRYMWPLYRGTCGLYMEVHMKLYRDTCGLYIYRSTCGLYIEVHVGLYRDTGGLYEEVHLDSMKRYEHAIVLISILNLKQDLEPSVTQSKTISHNLRSLSSPFRII